MSNGHPSIEQIEALSQEQSHSLGRERSEEWSHIEGCDRCKHLLEKFRAFDAKLNKLASVPLPTKDGMSCPDRNIWFEVAAGALSDEESQKYLLHAALCNNCGRKLRFAAEMVDDEDISPEEEELLASIPQSDISFSGGLETQYKGSPPPEEHRFPAHSLIRGRTWSYLIYASAAAVAAVFVLFLAFGKYLRKPEDNIATAEHLLSQSYTEHRDIELRFANAGHSRLTERRGPNESSLNVPKSRLAAADLIKSGTEKYPGSPAWLLLQAQLDLLDFRYKPALDEIEKARNLGAPPSELHSVTGMALFEEAEDADDQHQAELYGRAYDNLSKALQDNPNDHAALFNRALTCQRLNWIQCALEDWESLLKTEADPGWAAEARQHLNEIKQLKEKKTPTPRS